MTIDEALKLNDYAALALELAGHFDAERENLDRLLKDELTETGQAKVVNWIYQLLPKNASEPFLVLAFNMAWMVFTQSDPKQKYDPKLCDKYQMMVLNMIINH